jgi:branched-chain amino acid transport system permease protein
VLGTRLQYQTIGIWLMLAVVLGGLSLLLTKTKIGLAFRAVSSNVESARLVGVNTGQTLGFGWALASAFGTLGAALVAPTLGGIEPNMMAFILIYSLAGAALGGLDSLGGAVLGGSAGDLCQSSSSQRRSWSLSSSCCSSLLVSSGPRRSNASSSTTSLGGKSK